MIRSKLWEGACADSGVSASPSINCAAAIEASLKLDISHRGSAVPTRSTAGQLTTCQPGSNVGGGLLPVSQPLYQLCRRHRSLAEARPLPQGISGAHEIYSRATSHLPTELKCGRGLAPDSGGSASPSINCAAVIEASLKLDISHRGSAVPIRPTAGRFLPVNNIQMWEGACSR